MRTLKTDELFIFSETEKLEGQQLFVFEFSQLLFNYRSFTMRSDNTEIRLENLKNITCEQGSYYSNTILLPFVILSQ